MICLSGLRLYFVFWDEDGCASPLVLAVVRPDCVEGDGEEFEPVGARLAFEVFDFSDACLLEEYGGDGPCFVLVSYG